MTKIFIVAVRRDPIRRRVWEDVFAEELAKHGVNAVQSYRLFPQAVAGFKPNGPGRGGKTTLTASSSPEGFPKRLLPIM